MSKFYITTAIDYANAPPHIGHAYEKICADVIARWHRFIGDDVHFLTGTDENAQKNVEAAREAGVDTREFVDNNSKKFMDLCSKLDISNDDFIKTTEERHVRVLQSIFKKMYDKGDIYKGFYEGLYCQGCEGFITARELEDGKCPEHLSKPKLIKEESYFFRLSKYQEQILKLLTTDFVEPESRRKEVYNRVKEGLNDLSASRKDVAWGIDVPIDSSHKIYVWIDALVNYISALGYPDNELFKKYWPADLHLIGKGINWFHSVIWPAMLMSAEIELPKKIFVHGYVNISGQKVSKSLGNIVDPVTIVEQYGVDALRYFMLREISFGLDGDYSQAALIKRLNSDLANDIGNLLHRTLTMIEKYFEGSVPDARSALDAGTQEQTIDKELTAKAEALSKDLEKAMNSLDFSAALANIWELINKANKYIEETAPWKLAKEDRPRLQLVCYNLLEVLRIISVAIVPFMPQTAGKMAVQLGIEDRIKNAQIKDIEQWGQLRPGGKIAKGEPMFPRI